MKTIGKILVLLVAATAVTANAAQTFNEHTTTTGTGAGAQNVLSGTASDGDWMITASLVLQTTTTKDNVNHGSQGAPPVSTTATTVQVELTSLSANLTSSENLSGTVTLSSGYTLSSSSASLNPITVHVSGYKYTGIEDPVFVERDVVVSGSWAATGKAGRIGYKCNENSSFRFNYDSDSKSSDATFSGQLVLDGSNLLSGASATASIGSFTTSIFSGF